MDWIFDRLAEILVEFVNFLINETVLAVNILLSILPNSPFRELILAVRVNLGSEFLGYVNYFLPVSEIAVVLAMWVVAIVMYYAVSAILRWAKVVA
jgi:hypothetical protein